MHVCEKPIYTVKGKLQYFSSGTLFSHLCVCVCVYVWMCVQYNQLCSVPLSVMAPLLPSRHMKDPENDTSE